MGDCAFAKQRRVRLMYWRPLWRLRCVLEDVTGDRLRDLDKITCLGSPTNLPDYLPLSNVTDVMSGEARQGALVLFSFADVFRALMQHSATIQHLLQMSFEH